MDYTIDVQRIGENIAVLTFTDNLRVNQLCWAAIDAMAEQLGRCRDSGARVVILASGLTGHWLEHAWLRDTGRVTYVSATDKEALDALQLCTRLEGIIPALEPAHALSYVTKLAPKMAKDQTIVMNLCGRGDKDLFTVAKALGMKI